MFSTAESLSLPVNGTIASPGGMSGSGRATAAINCGRVVVPGADNLTVKAPTSAAEVRGALGLSVYSPSKTPASETNLYAAGEAVDYLFAGEMWVEVESTVVRGQALFVRFVGAVGALRGDADTDEASAHPGIIAQESRTGAGLVKVKVNLPSQAAAV